MSQAAYRSVLYSRGVHENDLRDILLYNRVRPKFFASEPASVTFCYTLFTFIWMVVSPWRWKLALYLVLVGAGLFAMPGPTLMLVLILPYMLFLGPQVRQATGPPAAGSGACRPDPPRRLRSVGPGAVS